uniref:Uncharacterized protein n=1 Tax=Arundo donax TaxID=35708 RepID=A0A0A9B4H9_ARUDO
MKQLISQSPLLIMCGSNISSGFDVSTHNNYTPCYCRTSALEYVSKPVLRNMEYTLTGKVHIFTFYDEHYRNAEWHIRYFLLAAHVLGLN